jgi:hypothetical protein
MAPKSMTYLLPFFQWLDQSWVGSAIRGSKIAFPIIELFHLFALTMLLGTTIVISLRLLNVLFRDNSVLESWSDIAAINTWSIIVMLVSGSLLLSSEAVRMYENPSFRIKVALLLTALIFHFSFFLRIVRFEESAVSPIRRKIAAIGDLVLWVGVGMAGRGIAF